MSKKILVLFAHPVKEKSRVNKVLLDKVSNIEGITVHDLYEAYPDFQINIKHEQLLLLEHDVIVWQHPFYWFNVPALLKEWMDLVLEHDFAYGSQRNALKDKMLLSAISAGASRKAYCDKGRNCHSLTQFLLPYKQLSVHCNMQYLPPFVVNGTHLLKENDIVTYAENYKKVLIALRDNKIDQNKLIKCEYLNDIIQ